MKKTSLILLIFSSILLKDSFTLAVSEDEVVVHVWKPNSERWGHVSLETDKYYMSFWPHNKTLGSPSSGAIITSLRTDADSYNEYPNAEYKISNRTLGCEVSIGRINNRFEDFLLFNQVQLNDWNSHPQRNLPHSKWAPIGTIEAAESPYFREDFYRTPQSCVTFSWNILNSGIIYHSLLNSIFNTLNYIPHAPLPNYNKNVSFFEMVLKKNLKRKTWMYSPST